MTTLPARTVIVETEDTSVERVCFEYALLRLGDRKRAGRLTGYVRATLAANPGLARLGLVLPLGTRIALPEYEVPVARATVALWGRS